MVGQDRKAQIDITCRKVQDDQSAAHSNWYEKLGMDHGEIETYRFDWNCQDEEP